MNYKKIFKKALVKKYPGIYILLSIFLITAIVVFCSNILTFIVPTFDQFSVFHRYSKIYSISDWNLPHVVRVDMDHDRIDDVVTPSGCVFISTMYVSSVGNNPSFCTDNLVHEGKTHGFKIPQVSGKFVRSFIAKESENWYIVVQTVSETNRYFISPMGLVPERDTQISVALDSILYLLSHLYILVL